MTSTAVLLVIAIVGTTVAPWQLFFQQSNIVDKRITPRWINYERADTVIGSFVVVVAATALVVTAAFGLQGTPLAGHFTNAEGVARGLDQLRRARHRTVLRACPSQRLDHRRRGCDVVDLLRRRRHLRDPALACTAASKTQSSSTSSSPGWWSWRRRSCSIPGAPFGLITTSVQALAGVLLPSATVFLLLLCNDKQVLGSLGQPPVAQRAGRVHRRRAAGALAHLDGDDGVPKPECRHTCACSWRDYRDRIPRR